MDRTIASIETIVIEYFKITREQLWSKRRFAKLSIARHIVWYELYRVAGMTERDIAKAYNTCPSNVNFAKRNVVNWLRFTPAIKRDIEIIERQIENEKRMDKNQ